MRESVGLTAVTAFAIDNVNARSEQAAIRAGGLPGGAARAGTVFAPRAVWLSTLAAWVAGHCAVVAAWAVKFMCGPTGSCVWAVGVEAAGVSQVAGREDSVHAASAANRIEVVVLSLAPGRLPP